MKPLTYKVRSKYTLVMYGSTELGSIVYSFGLTGWVWRPRKGPLNLVPRLTWPDVKPDVEAWWKNNGG